MTSNGSDMSPRRLEAASAEDEGETTDDVVKKGIKLEYEGTSATILYSCSCVYLLAEMMSV